MKNYLNINDITDINQTISEAIALKKDGQKIHNTTVQKYLEYLVTSFVFYKVNRFDLKGKIQLATQEKYYLVDVGLLNILVGKARITDRGHILENIVYLELIRRGNKVWEKLRPFDASLGSGSPAS